MKVLLSAYACEPGRGTEPGVGWNTAWEIAKYHEVWILTRPDDGKEAIEAELQRNPNPNLHFVYFTLPILGSLWRQGGSIAFLIHYYLWQIQAFFVARRLHAEIGFELSHHVTFVKYSVPSFLALLPIPFIFGPVGGAESAPTAFAQDFRWRGKIHEFLRGLSQWFGERDPFTQMTVRRSVLSWATTPETAERLVKMGASRVEVLSQVGLLPEEVTRMEQFPLSDCAPLRFISIGRLLHWKGFDLGLRAFAQANLPKEAQYWLIGSGSEQDYLQQLVVDLGIADRVKFLAQMPRQELFLNLGTCTALVHPSLHESGGFVCLEAMAAGRPVICLNLGGPAVQVTEETGFKIPALSPTQVITGLAKAMSILANDPELRLSMGRAGQQRVKEFYNWEVRGHQMCQLYDNVVKARLIQPESIA
ncbi:glycosyltransferase family 4 protein [Chamaesiphon minutus]|uniref:Glycosyltransferase n=1 Tax=Chamaesiphon minutus (strain ATCC 27169 / PCC 6605) TaxID=1173020 RepID=K9UQS6_CHAP6|nr:glycosyltransferase [Chamaesiphon minutus]AFY96786.1 glycosyltransferase [Chamaesiphon minutus PCC 6605]